MLETGLLSKVVAVYGSSVTNSIVLVGSRPKFQSGSGGHRIGHGEG